LFLIFVISENLSQNYFQFQNNKKKKNIKTFMNSGISGIAEAFTQFIPEFRGFYSGYTYSAAGRQTPAYSGLLQPKHSRIILVE
jgi:hypothetical protein